MKNIKQTTVVIGEGITEKYYLQSLKGYIDASIKPLIPDHASSMKELERLIKECIEDGFDNIFCLIDMDNKKDGQNKLNYQRLKTKYHDKIFLKKKKGTQSQIHFFENERCLEMWFYFYFKNTTKEYKSSDNLLNDLECFCKYQKTEKFFISCKGIHSFLERNGGSIDLAIKCSQASMISKNSDSREYTYSEMAIFFEKIKKKRNV